MIKIDNLIIKTEDYELFTTGQLVINKGENMLLIGNNSTGKTLFLKTLHKRYFNHNGNFEISASGIFKKKRKLSLLIENEANILLDKTIYKNIVLPLDKINDKKLELIMNMCNIAKLGEIYSTKCSVLSYSQLKMVEIIRAIMVNPVVILVDDIDNYFDDVNMSILFELLEQSKKDFSFIATSKKLIERFKNVYRIQNKNVVKL